MSSFIQQLVSELLERHHDLKRLCVVFPTRRAGLFFQKELSRKISKPSWSPVIQSIQDYIHQYSGRNIPDNITLLFELFESYKEFFPLEDFARFLPWGELMLRDFDDIDKYLVNASRAFSTITDLHEIDRNFELPEEDLENLRVFWRNFFNRDPSLLRNEFLNTWQYLSRIYASFRKKLLNKNLAYEGMAYRMLVEEMSEGKRIADEHSHIVFAGFYALTPAEQSIIGRHVEEGRATLYWDADPYYADDTLQEAGRFFRNNKLIERKYLWKQEHFKTISKSIEFAGVPNMVGQAKYAGTLLQSMTQQDGFDPERTAVVLPDEKLLFPVLYSLPAGLQYINVTMGYPLSQTPLYNLFESLIALQKNAREEKDDITFYFRDILNILNHPYIRMIADKQIRTWLDNIDQQFIRMPGSRLVSDESDKFFRNIFIQLTSVSHAFGWFREILRMILEAMKADNFSFHRIESEFVYHFYTHLSRLEDIMSGKDVVGDISLFWKIFREILASGRIPFSGEPLRGLQVMGFLETRVLDFDTVVVLSVNEDVLPSGGSKPSFIPFNIRKAFGLPTFEEQNAVSAYHFYRLIQRAKNIYLIYNTEPKSITTGERSRFMLQIEHELKKKFPDNIKIVKKVISTRTGKENVEELVVNKDDGVMTELSRFLANGKDPASVISASGLTTYITCPLRFYFRYVAGLQELDEQEENMEAATFGRVLHKAMQNLYEGVSGLDESTISKLKAKVNEHVDRAIHETFVSINQLEGKNILLRNILRELIHKILESDRRDLPFQIMQLEKNVSEMFRFGDRTVKLYGIIDRVDEKENALRIIDYKTGRIEKKKPASLEDYFTDPAFKEQFQAMYYAFLTRRKVPGREIKSGLLTMRTMSEGIWYLNNGNPFTDEQFDEFERLLSNLLSEIFSRDTSFTQTIDEDRCGYCAYKSICNR